MGDITSPALPWVTGTYTRDPLHTHETQTAALVVADNSVILHFLKALWSYAITQPRSLREPHGFTFPQEKKKRSSSCTPHMAKAWAGIRRGGRKSSVCMSVDHGRSLLLPSSKSPTHLCKGNVNLPPEWDVTLPLLPLFLCSQIFLCPTFMSSSPALPSRRDKDSALNQKQEEDQSQIYHLTNDFVKWSTTAASACFCSSARLSHSKLTICPWSLTPAHTLRTRTQVHVHVTHMHARTHTRDWCISHSEATMNPKVKAAGSDLSSPSHALPFLWALNVAAKCNAVPLSPPLHHRSALFVSPLLPRLSQTLSLALFSACFPLPSHIINSPGD